jgi:carbonic anhydrase
MNNKTHHINRRRFLASLAGGTASLAMASLPSLVRAAALPFVPGSQQGTMFAGTDLSAEAALKRLMEGNARYIASKAEHPDQTADRRIEVAKAQKPFAVILTCSDSRVAPELLFDQGLGDLFVLRTAGNVLADVVTGSIEYAVEELGVPLIMVLGHERCGAVSAAVDVVTKNAKLPGHIASLTTAIAPAVEKVKAMSGDILDNSVKQNAIMGAQSLQDAEPILAEAYHAKKIMVVAGRYDLEEGKVELLDLGHA